MDDHLSRQLSGLHQYNLSEKSKSRTRKRIKYRKWQKLGQSGGVLLGAAVVIVLAVQFSAPTNVSPAAITNSNSAALENVQVSVTDQLGQILNSSAKPDTNNSIISPQNTTTPITKKSTATIDSVKENKSKTNPVDLPSDKENKPTSSLNPLTLPEQASDRAKEATSDVQIPTHSLPQLLK